LNFISTYAHHSKLVIVRKEKWKKDLKFEDFTSNSGNSGNSRRIINKEKHAKFIKNFYYENGLYGTSKID
jgi:hypothetical protein